MPGHWPDDARFLLTDLLLVGHAAIPVIEALDQLGLWHRMIPEWEPCRSKPQRNAYHRFTVDRHLCEAAAQAAALVDRVDRPDLLVLGALSTTSARATRATTPKSAFNSSIASAVAWATATTRSRC